jgi:hypothetical protein
MTPYERTLSVLTSLDTDLSTFDSGNHELDEKITFTLNWLTRNIEIETIYQMLDTETFDNKAVILDLLDEPAFNVLKGN